MVGNIRLAGRRTASTAGGVIVALLGAFAAFIGVALSGTKTGAVGAIGAVTLPILFGLSLFAPLLFPFGAYAFLTPFDAVLKVGAAATVTKLFGAASAAALLFYILRSKRYSDPDRSVAMWFVYALWITASAFWAIDPKQSLDVIPTVLLLFGLYAVISLIRTDMRTLTTVVQLTMVGGAAAAAYVLYLYHSGVAIKENRMWLATGNVNWNPDYLAGTMLLPAAIALMSIVFGKTLGTRVLAFICGGIILPVFVLTGARGPELGLIVMIVYLLVREPNRARLAWPVGIVAALGLAYAAPTLGQRWANALSTGGAGRTDIWHVGFVAFKQNWLFGVGYNNFPLAYDRAWIQVFQPQYIGWGHVSHNIIVGHAVELGVIGLALLLMGWFWQFRALRGIPISDPRYRLRLVLEASIIGLFISGLFADMMLQKCVWLAFMLVSLTRNAAPEPAPAAERSAVVQGVTVHA